MSAREAWSATPMPAVIVPAAVGAELATALRKQFERASYTRYALLDRASYDFIDAKKVPELLHVAEVLAGVASEVTGRALTITSGRVIRMAPGDYLLVRHDKVHDDSPVELVLDLSSTVVPGAEVHWRHRGRVYFAMASTPGALALVERGPTVMSNHTYVSKLHSNAEVVRLMMLARAHA